MYMYVRTVIHMLNAALCCFAHAKESIMIKKKVYNKNYQKISQATAQ